MWRHLHREPPLPTAREVTPGLLEAERAHAEARGALEDVIHQGPEVRGVMGRVFEHGKQNHWGTVLDNIWRDER